MYFQTNFVPGDIKRVGMVRRKKGKGENAAAGVFAAGELGSAIGLLRRVCEQGGLKRKLRRRLRRSLDQAAGWRGGRYELFVRILTVLARLD